MRKGVLIIILIVLIPIAAYRLLTTEGPWTGKLEGIRLRLDQTLESRGLPSLTSITEKKKSGETVVIHFKNGKTLIGELLEETQDRYVVKWKGEEVIVYAEQVARIGSKDEITKEKTVLTDQEITQWWPYENEVVIRLTNRIVADAKIRRIKSDVLTLLYVIEGGHIEQDIPRSKVEYLLFKPVENQESNMIEESLKKKFPGMKPYKVGNFTIFTDSHESWVQEYIKIVRNVYTDIYLTFFGLFKNREPQRQNFLVIFDDFIDYFKYAVSEGVPAWAVPGYYDPQDRMLYLFNSLGEKFSEILFEAMVGETGRSIDYFVEHIEGFVDQRYHIFIEGQAKKIKDKFWDGYSFYKGIYRSKTENTLRHEFTHEIFSNWDLQDVEISKLREEDKKLAEEKEDILEADDYKKKAELLKSLVTLGEEPLDLLATNSWLSEGLATYCATYPIGSQDDILLFLFQEMEKEGAVYPLESLTGYKIGSFHGVCSRAKLYLYAQSWAFVTFLINKYPQEFIEYQNRLATEVAQEYDDIDWLCEALGKDLRTVEQEFTQYMAGYKKIEDPYITRAIKLRNIFDSMY